MKKYTFIVELFYFHIIIKNVHMNTFKYKYNIVSIRVRFTSNPNLKVRKTRFFAIFEHR